MLLFFGVAALEPIPLGWLQVNKFSFWLGPSGILGNQRQIRLG